MKRAMIAVVLIGGIAGAAVIEGGRKGGSGGSVVDVLAELVGKDVNADSYTATATTGPAFNATGNLVDAVRLGTSPRATIGTCQSGSVCIGPDDLGYATKLYVWGDIITQMVQVRDSIDVLGNAAILNNNGPVRIVDTDGLSINGSTPIKARYILPGIVVDFEPVPNGACGDPVDIPVPEAKAGDFVGIQAEFDYGEDAPDVTVRGLRAPADGIVRVKACNASFMTEEDPPSGPYKIRLER